MITTYTELQTSVANWLNRSGDADVTAVLPELIQLAESKIGRLLKRKTVRAALTLDSGAVTLPTTLGELRSVRLDGALGSQKGNVQIVTPETLADMRRLHVAAGQPRWGSVVDRELLLVPAPDQSYASEIIYFKKLVPLSVTNTTNDELTEAPDMYLFGTLTAAAKFLENDERVPTWQSEFAAAIEELNTKRQDEEYGASIRPVRLPRVF